LAPHRGGLGFVGLKDFETLTSEYYGGFI
jgi:hypothetical protein